jgi:hypothetical protein
VIIASALLAHGSGPVAAEPCGESSVRGNIKGDGDRVRLSLGGSSANCASLNEVVVAAPQPYYTYEIVCSTDRSQASIGVCSATPCPTSFYALRTIHFPDGSSEPAGFRCVTLDQAKPRQE